MSSQYGVTVADSGHDALTMVQQHQQQQNETYTLVVVRCRGNLTWLDEVPADWRILVYEKCQSNNASTYSVLTAINGGNEECNGYLDFLVDYYDKLTSVTVFMHDDGLWAWSKSRGMQAHTPFDSFGQVINATQRYLTPTQGYITLGVMTKKETSSWKNGYHGKAFQVIWPYLRTDDMPNPPEVIHYKPSAHMAVRRSAIQSRPKSTYEALLKQMRYSKDVPEHLTSRQLCCAMERSWHYLFGVSPELPMETRVFDMMAKAEAFTKDYKWNPYDGL